MIERKYQCGPGYGTRGKRAYEARQQGQSWAEIAAMLALSGSSDPESAATNVAKKYAKERGLPWPLRVVRASAAPVAPKERPELEQQKRAYEARSQGRPWDEVMREAGYRHVPNAMGGAKRYALREGKSWPIVLT